MPETIADLAAINDVLADLWNASTTIIGEGEDTFESGDVTAFMMATYFGTSLETMRPLFWAYCQVVYFEGVPSTRESDVARDLVIGWVRTVFGLPQDRLNRYGFTAERGYNLLRFSDKEWVEFFAEKGDDCYRDLSFVMLITVFARLYEQVVVTRDTDDEPDANDVLAGVWSSRQQPLHSTSPT
jgi:hypothetical protein